MENILSLTFIFSFYRLWHVVAIFLEHLSVVSEVWLLAGGWFIPELNG